jgi:uncharacterized protein
VYIFSVLIVGVLARYGGLGFSIIYPYFHSEMSVRNDAKKISFYSRRDAVIWRGEYQPTSEKFDSQPGSLPYWLTERYCLYVANKGQIQRGNIHHYPWPLQDADVRIDESTVLRQLGLETAESRPSLISFAQELHVLIWPLEKVPHC